MRINTELILRCSSKNLLPSHSGDEDTLKRITHLYLQEQYIRTIENLEMCINLVALYLYDNKIGKIENVEHLDKLSCLYLQNNRILKMENLQGLQQLTVLNLSYNTISKLEGLETLCELRELYLQYQRIPEGTALDIENESVIGISETLRVLNISGNGLQSLSPLKPLSNLLTLLAEDNEIEDLNDLVDTICEWPCVTMMKLNGNPMCKNRKYRDNVVVNCLELEELDGRLISQSYRNFLLNWKQCQTLQCRKKESYEVLMPYLAEPLKMKALFCLVIASACVAATLALSACQEHRERELKNNDKVKLVPKCDENGDYEPMQCFEGSPFCMCWRKDGTHLTKATLKLKSCNCIVHKDSVMQRKLIGNYHPQCEADGTYSRTQCHGGVGYCWCVDENGQKVNKSLNDC